jgi:hypothetical protein
MPQRVSQRASRPHNLPDVALSKPPVRLTAIFRVVVFTRAYCVTQRIGRPQIATRAVAVDTLRSSTSAAPDRPGRTRGRTVCEPWPSARRPSSRSAQRVQRSRQRDPQLPSDNRLQRRVRERLDFVAQLQHVLAASPQRWCGEASHWERHVLGRLRFVDSSAISACGGGSPSSSLSAWQYRWA